MYYFEKKKLISRNVPGTRSEHAGCTETSHTRTRSVSGAAAGSNGMAKGSATGSNSRVKGSAAGSNSLTSGLASAVPYNDRLIAAAFLLAMLVLAILVIAPLAGPAYADETEKVTIHFAMNGHGLQIADEKIDKGSTFYGYDNKFRPDSEADTYHFIGWYEDSGLSVPYKPQKITADTTLYAGWTEPAHKTLYRHDFTLSGVIYSCGNDKQVVAYYQKEKEGVKTSTTYNSDAENTENQGALISGHMTELRNWIRTYKYKSYSIRPENESTQGVQYLRLFAKAPITIGARNYATGDFVATRLASSVSDADKQNYFCLTTWVFSHNYHAEATLLHSWTPWTTSKKATVTEEGEMSHSCTTCGEKETTSIPMVTLIKDEDSSDDKPSGNTGKKDKTTTSKKPTEDQANNATVTKSLKKIASSKITTAASSKKKTMLIKFAKVKGAAIYRIQYRKAGARKWTSYWTSSRSYTIKKLKTNQLFEFRVAAYRLNKSGSWERGAWSAINYRYYRGVKSKTMSKDGVLTVKMKSAKGASGYQVFYSTKSSMKGKKTVRSKKPTVRLKNLKPKTPYYIQTRPYKDYKGHRYIGILYTINT